MGSFGGMGWTPLGTGLVLRCAQLCSWQMLLERSRSPQLGGRWMCWCRFFILLWGRMPLKYMCTLLCILRTCMYSLGHKMHILIINIY